MPTCISKPFVYSFIIIWTFLHLFSYKMVDNRSKTSLITHIWKSYITDEQHNSRAKNSYNIVILILDIFWSFIYHLESILI